MYLMKKRLMEDFDVDIITPSKWLADRVKLSFFKEKNIEVIHNGIDTNVFKPEETSKLRKELNIPKENKIVVSIAPDIMIERKGGKQVLKLAEAMSEQPITFVLVGAK